MDDFASLQDGASLHVLNVISQVLISSIAFAKQAVDLLLKGKGRETYALPV
jgi:hypothetical protein